ncbi:MAG: RNA polymerase sigma factor [Candidatus Gracilibacteria bacterium]|nr:RNA polymerase sigma factor [Candidatus Gracilibacteria bacterium]
MEDLKIMQRCLDGQLEYFGKIYEKYIDKIYKFVYLKTTNKELAEDIVSDVFISALNSINSFRIDETSSVKSWIYRIAHNKVIDYYRTFKQTEDIGDYLDMSVQTDNAEQIDNKDKLNEVLQYLNTIKKEQREILIYRIWDDLSYNEISEITGKSVDNCKKIVSRQLKIISANFVIFIFILIMM